MSRRNRNEIAYSDLTESGEDGEDDGVGLVLKEESDSKLSRTRKYMVTPHTGFRRCHPSRLSRNERICLVVGAVALVALVAVFITVGVVASPTPQVAENENDTGEGGNEGGDHTGGGGSGDHSNTGGQNGTENGTGQSTVPWSDIRLQSSVVPELYDISLSVNMDTFKVTGSVSIQCTVLDSVDYIALHAKGMDITHHQVMMSEGGLEMEHSAVAYPQNDFFIFNFSESMSPGSISIVLEFNYTLREQLNGFYRSSYTDAGGNTQFLATTQFEPTDARKAFPCFDEPSLKANFTMHMTHQSQYRAWFNMPAVSNTTDDATGLVTTHFMTSRRMSTYLVAFIVSDFECMGNTINSTSGKEIKVSE